MFAVVSFRPFSVSFQRANEASVSPVFLFMASRLAACWAKAVSSCGASPTSDSSELRNCASEEPDCRAAASSIRHVRARPFCLTIAVPDSYPRRPMSPASFSLGRSSSMTAALYCVAAFAVPPEVSVSAENCAPISSALMLACFETLASSPMTGMTSPTVVLPCFSMAKRRSEASAALI